MMTSLFTSVWAWLQPLGAPPLGLLQPGPDSPFGDLLGYVIIFFVIVWPILRGLLETAKKQRAEFEEKERQAGHRSAPSPNRKARRTLEEILEGKLERVDSYDEPEVAVKAAPQRPKRKPLPPPSAPEPKAAAFGDRPMDESSAPVYHLDDLHGDSDAELGGDPFDEDSMEAELVSEARLAHVPTEDELESSLESALDGMPRRAISARPGPAAKAPVGAPNLDALRSEDPEAIFRAMGRPLSPWQKAMILKEVLGQPLAARPAPTLTDLPS